MSLELYQIWSTLISHPDHYATLKDDSYHKELFSFFMMNQGDAGAIKKIEMIFLADRGYTLKNIVQTDYIPSSSAMLFSKKFVVSVGEILGEEMQFFPVKMICKDASLDWYAAQITHFFPVVDKVLSKYRKSTTGKQVLSYIKFRTDIDENFYIARDSDNTSYVAVSDLFKNLCEENGLMLRYRQP